MKRTLFPVVFLMGVSISSAHANDYRVYSAAGVLPDQQMARLAETEMSRQRELIGRMPPPLPENYQASMTAPMPTHTPSMTAPVSPANRVSPGVSPAVSQVQNIVNRDLNAVMNESVTIDVQDMRWEDIVTNIMPAGWRVRFQRVGETVLEQRADITITNASRREVLHALLSRAGLAFEPFPEFDQPLLIVSKQNGAQ